jgi:uncharacterized protein (DUF305 family)
VLTPRRARWRAALLTGLLSGTFSTILITLGAPRIGRSRALDWMEIGTVLLGVDSVVRQPGWQQIAAGVLVHQSADLFWAVIFFGAAGRWTARLPPIVLLFAGIPWAVGTSAIEYYLMLPWLQPLVPMQVPYWTALGVHLTSAAAYPAFPWVHARVLRITAPAAPKQRAKGAAKIVYVLAAVVAVFLAIEMSVRAGWEPRIEVGGKDATFDRTFMRHMRAHHEVGVRLADLSIDRSARVHVQELGRLMVANQSAEIETLDGWWRRWFRGRIPPVPHEDHRQISGMPSAATMHQLEQLDGVEFERRLFPVMIAHHRGAVLMADRAWQDAADVRLRVFAESLRHAQRGQIERMAELQKEE